MELLQAIYKNILLRQSRANLKIACVKIHDRDKLMFQKISAFGWIFIYYL